MSAEYVPFDILSHFVEEAEACASASWNVGQVRSFHPQVSKAVPVVDAYVLGWDASPGVKRRCWSEMEYAVE